MAPVLPPRDDKPEGTKSSGVVFPLWLFDRLTQIAKERRYSRNEVIIRFLSWALQEHEREEKEQLEREQRAAAQESGETGTAAKSRKK